MIPDFEPHYTSNLPNDLKQITRNKTTKDLFCNYYTYKKKKQKIATKKIVTTIYTMEKMNDKYI